MPRPKHKRIITQLPPCREFKADIHIDPVILTLDEWEAIRLIDEEGLDQSACASKMHVSRATVQNIISRARQKTASALVYGRSIKIAGGSVEYIEDDALGCCAESSSAEKIGGLSQQEVNQKMKIAVCYDPQTEEIFQHFGRTEYFKVYEVKDREVLSSAVYSTNGEGHGALAGVLKQLQADILICGGIGAGAQNALSAMGIQLFGGCTGKADDAVSSLLNGRLHYQEDVQCSHHHEGGCEHHCH